MSLLHEAGCLCLVERRKRPRRSFMTRLRALRCPNRDTRTAAVGSDAALRKLLGLKMGQQVKLKCRQTDEGSIIVEEAKRAKNAWKWAFITLGILATAGAVWLYLIFHGGD